MFDLEREIQRWRRELLACGLGGSQVEELEDHLRTDIEEQLRSGVAVREAFEAAARRIGRGSELKRQFDRARATRRRGTTTILVKAATGWVITWIIVLAAVYCLSSVGTALKIGALLLGVTVLVFLAELAWSLGRRSQASPALNPINKFTPCAQQCLDLARGEALRLGHDFVGTEHLLLAVTSFDTGVLARVLEKAGVTRDALRQEIEKRISGYTAQGFTPGLPFTPRLDKALRLAGKEAALDRKQIDAAHVLVGLISERSGVAGSVLRSLGLSVGNIRSSLT
jgi:hypothetical protein